MQGFASDGANAMRGKWNSVLSRLLERKEKLNKELKIKTNLWSIWC